MSAHALGAEAEDLEALFDSIAAARSATGAAPAQASPQAPGEVMARIARMARVLNGCLRALDDAEPADATAPDRLASVAAMNGKAAAKALNAAEMAKPIQDQLAQDADRLASRWDDLFAAQPGVDAFKALVAATRDYLRGVPAQARATNAQLTAVILAQDFHDLTGQVLGRVGDVVRELERELVELLAEHAAPNAAAVPASSRAAGIERAGEREIVKGQRQVDELLHSLGL